MKKRNTCRVSTTLGAAFFGAAAFTVLFGQISFASIVAAAVIFLFGVAVCVAGKIAEF